MSDASGWDSILRDLSPRRFAKLLDRNVKLANRRIGHDVEAHIKGRIVDQVDMQPNTKTQSPVGPGGLHPYTVHRRATRNLLAKAKAGDRQARRVLSRQRVRGRERAWRRGRGPHKRLINRGNAGLLGSIGNQPEGLSVVVGMLYRRGSVDIGKVQEFGARIRVTPKMRRFLHATGLHLKPSTTHIEIPAQHFMGRGLRKADVIADRQWDRAVDATVRGVRYRPGGN